MIKLLFYLFCIIHVSNSHVMNNRMCWIKGTMAVCSGHGNNLTYIPSLPSQIKTLRFNFNRLPHVSSRTFVNVTTLKLQTLHLVGDHIEMISSTAFQELKYLKYLDISHNTIPSKVIGDAFIGLSKTPIERLDMLAMGLHFIPPHFFDNLNVSKINTIHLHQNYLKLFNCSDFHQMKHLKHVGVGQNFIYRLVITPECALAELDMAYNTVKYVCGDGIASTSLKLLDIKSNGVYHVDYSTFKCFPNLQELFLGGNYISRLPANVFAGLSELSLLSMINNPNMKLIDAGAFSNDNLRKLLIVNAREKFLNYNWDMFKGSHLVSLDVSENNLNQMSTDRLQRLFQPLKDSLRVLVITDASLTTIPAFISILTKLYRLKVNNNLITGWSPNTLYFLNSLEHLDLSRNDIAIVTEGSFPDNIFRSLQTVDMSNNPFDCSCANLWFLKLFQSHIKIFTSSRKPRCSSPARMVPTFLNDVHMTDNACLLTLTSQLIVIVSTSVLVAIFVISLLLFKYRWHLRYLLYMYNNGRRREHPEVDENFLYDVFVVYSSDDSDWVVDKLVPKLEGELGLKLCVHERNFVPGRLIVDNIVTSIDSSKKIMVILSNNFSQSDWCKFELNVIQRHILEKGQDLLVVVVLEELNRRHMTPTMFTMLQTTTYIQWPDHLDAEDGFWNNLTVGVRVH